MIYLYYDSKEKILYAYQGLVYLATNEPACKWENIDNVTADYTGGQINAHELGKGKVVEFPLIHTVLTCKKPINV